MQRLFYKYCSDEPYILGFEKVFGFGKPREKILPDICQYCKYPLATSSNEAPGGFQDDMFLDYKFCLRCGWWYISTSKTLSGLGPAFTMENNHYAILRKLKHDSEIELPINLLINEIALNPERVYEKSPRELEYMVASIFSNILNCTVELTKGTRDGGKDLIGFDSSGGKFVVEVKRYRENKKVGVSIVRDLLGAMCIEEIYTGFIVTTSKFSKDSRKLSEALNNRGVWKLELQDIKDLIAWFKLSFDEYFNIELLDKVIREITDEPPDSWVQFPRKFRKSDGREISL